MKIITIIACLLLASITFAVELETNLCKQNEKLKCKGTLAKNKSCKCVKK